MKNFLGVLIGYYWMIALFSAIVFFGKGWIILGIISSVIAVYGGFKFFKQIK